MTEEKRPGGLEPIRSANILEGQDKDSDYLLDNQSNSTKKLANIMDGMGLFAELKRRKEAGR